MYRKILQLHKQATQVGKSTVIQSTDLAPVIWSRVAFFIAMTGSIAVVAALNSPPAAAQTTDPSQVFEVCAQNFPTPTELACGAGSSTVGSGASKTAMGANAKATANGASAFGSGAAAPLPFSMALGIGSLTVAPNQISIGTLTNLYRLPGITSPASLASQSGPVSIVTSDAAGHLAVGSGSSSGAAWLLGGNTVGPNDYIGSNNGMPFIVKTTGQERMRVTPSGFVGIGTTNPTLHLEVHNAVNPVMGVSSNSALGRFGVATCAGCFSTVAALDDFVLGNGGLNVRDLLLTSRSDNPAGGAIRFATGTISGSPDTEKMRLTKAGDLGVGTTSPTARTEISHTNLSPGAVALRITNTDSTVSTFTESGIGFNVALASQNNNGNPNYYAARIYSKYDGQNVYDGRLTLQVRQAAGGSFNDVLSLKNSRVGIETINPLETLDVAGTVRLQVPSSGSNHLCSVPSGSSVVIAQCAPSDARLKTNLRPITNALDKLEQVHGVSFEWNDRYRAIGGTATGREIGVLAQDVERSFPELVSVRDDGYKQVAYERLTAVLVEAVKDLRRENEALKKRTDALERALAGRLAMREARR
jgi:hypothetical protein